MARSMQVIEEEFLFDEFKYAELSEPFDLKLNDDLIDSADDRCVCGICGEICFDENCLIEHERSHEDVVDDTIELSQESSHLRKKAVSYVGKIESGLFECTICKEKFPLKNTVREHYFKHHCGSEQQQCPHCEFACYSKCALDVHLVKCHTKRYACEICGKMFPYKYQLKTHINAVHLNIRNHTCDVCGKSFKTRANFDTHMSRHMDVRNFRCPYCPHKSRTNHDLTVHIRRHTGERPFNCDVCGRAFAHSINRIKHERTVHGKSLNGGLIIRFPDNELVDELQ